MALRMLIALAVLLAGCSGAGVRVAVPPSHRVFNTYPEALRQVVPVLCNGQARGLGTPISATTLVTAQHVIDGCSSVGWESRMGLRGSLVVAAFKACDSRQDATAAFTECDWAVLVTNEGGPSFETWAPVNRREPESGEMLWWLLQLPGGRAQVVSGRYVGLDASKHLHVDGVAWPGSSGSGIFNGDGELVGVLVGHDKPEKSANANALVWGNRIAGILR